MKALLDEIFYMIFPDVDNHELEKKMRSEGETLRMESLYLLKIGKYPDFLYICEFFLLSLCETNLKKSWSR